MYVNNSDINNLQFNSNITKDPDNSLCYYTEIPYYSLKILPLFPCPLGLWNNLQGKKR